jgi:hypothetical protein
MREGEREGGREVSSADDAQHDHATQAQPAAQHKRGTRGRSEAEGERRAGWGFGISEALVRRREGVR